MVRRSDEYADSASMRAGLRAAVNAYAAKQGGDPHRFV